MSFSFRFSDQISLHVKDRISVKDATRQERTAREILSRLESQPGIVLADEVGMGKTFVALAVAASVAIQDSRQRPVVIMVPSSLKDKWPRDFRVFQKWCSPHHTIRAEAADRPIDFLKLLDDPPENRAQIIFLTHGALSRQMSDGWVKLAMIHRALHRRRDVDHIRAALGRFAGKLLHMTWVDRRVEGLWDVLLSKPVQSWATVLKSKAIGLDAESDPKDVDDPVPEMILNVIQEMTTDKLFEAIQQIPVRASANLDANIAAAREVIEREVRSLWAVCLARMQLQLPLLILDEAHHLKNSQTRLSSLFHDPDAAEDVEQISGGALAGAFSRMLLLTATPFQLGHGELCNVLERFNGINWHGEESLGLSKDDFNKTVLNLRRTLDEAQSAALGFDSAWGRLAIGGLDAGGKHFENIDSWFSAALESSPQSDVGRAAVDSFQGAKQKLKVAEKALFPWIVRHLKDRQITVNKQPIDRRKRVSGAGILVTDIGTSDGGLPVQGDSLLPFLLAARAVSSSPQSRPVFAEGLASSYEAFLDTRRHDENSESKSVVIDDDVAALNSQREISADWYLARINEYLPKGSIDTSLSHPKVQATVDRVIDLWIKGEKVLVFCHYVATGRALRQCISHQMRLWVNKRASELFGCSPDDAERKLEALGSEIAEGSALTTHVDAKLNNLISVFPNLSRVAEDLLKGLRQYLQTPTFLVRFYPIGQKLSAEEAITHAFLATDASGVSFESLVNSFVSSLSHRAEEISVEDFVRDCLLLTPRTLQAQDVTRSMVGDEVNHDERQILMPNVRLANGDTKPESRRRLMLAFNTPFFPEVLVASAIMAEGVDLHLNCRHVIHHDLCWNPSTLEQRTGRVDRIGCKMESCGQSIHIYLPYVAETQDEKMYRVVMDREQWFNVVMGEKVTTSLAATDAMAQRLALPDAVVTQLRFDFST